MTNDNAISTIPVINFLKTTVLCENINGIFEREGNYINSMRTDVIFYPLLAIETKNYQNANDLLAINKDVINYVNANCLKSDLLCMAINAKKCIFVSFGLIDNTNHTHTTQEGFKLFTTTLQCIDAEFNTPEIVSQFCNQASIAGGIDDNLLAISL